jgi:hypothetical protein
LRLPF